ncbi:MAG: TonB-dependent receptor [Ignavibacteriae bacterium]|nr:TonB-dependent receptor [Ignavibacteriota bacterium]MCB9258296.1 TonB-dependent receptor [Ignavibacteriales bacterium]
MNNFSRMLLVLFASSIFLSAQNYQDSVNTFLTDTIFVTSSRYNFLKNESPLSISIIDQNEILKNVNPVSLKSILFNQPGIIVNNRFNLAQDERITIRGIGARSPFGVRGIRIILDGIPLTITDGQSQLNNLDIQNIESIEILKGPSSVLYGNSLGGVIFIKSNLYDQNSFLIKPEFTLGSFGLNKYNLSAQAKVNNINFFINGFYSKLNGFREHSKSEYYGYNFSSLATITKNFSITLQSNFFDAPFLLNPSSLNKTEAINNPTSVRSSVKLFGLAKKVNQFQNGITLSYNFSNSTIINSSVYHVSRSLLNSVPGRIIDLDRLFAGVRAEIENRLSILNKTIKLKFGIDYENQSDDRTEFLSEGMKNSNIIIPKNIFKDIIYGEKIIRQDENVENFGLFSHLSFSPIDKVNLFLGIRYDDYNFSVKSKMADFIDEIRINNLSSMAGLNYFISERLSLFGNYSNGFQTPTTNEFSNNPFGEGFNTSLKPEQINNFEFGFRYSTINNFKSEITFYKMNISNMLISYQSENEESFYRNAGKANNFGIESRLDLPVNKNLHFTVSYNFMNLKFDDYVLTEIVDGSLKYFQLKGKYLPGIPKHTINSSTDFQLIDNLNFQLNLNWTDKYFANDFNGPIESNSESIANYINDSYFITDLMINYKNNFGSILTKFKLQINNIFDVRYNDSIIPNAFGNNFFEPAAGRTIYLNLSLKL